jgi:NADPH:quinone reductase-like Zn-dependent oxidoreductase
MRAVQYSEYGDSGVLTIAEVPEPEPGPGQIRIRVRAAAVNRFDAKKRAGVYAGSEPLAEPVIPGSEAAGIVDRLGVGVTGVRLGDAVFGRGPRTYAEYAVLKQWAPTPDNLDPAAAAGLGSTAQTAVRALQEVELVAGETVLVHGAAGGVGQATVQLARHLGAATVIGTASARNHDLLRELGAIPVAYGRQLVENVRAAAAQVDRIVDTAGKQIDELIEIAGDPQRILSLVDFSGRTRIRTSSGASEPEGVLELVADLVRRGDYTARVAATFPLEAAAAAHDLSVGGHANGKIVLLVEEVG